MTQENKDALGQFFDYLIQRLLVCREIVMSQFFPQIFPSSSELQFDCAKLLEFLTSSSHFFLETNSFCHHSKILCVVFFLIN